MGSARWVMLAVAALGGLGALPVRGADQYERDWHTGGFHVVELRKDSAEPALFRVVRIERVHDGDGHLRIYLPAECRDAVRAALDAGGLAAEISGPGGGAPAAAGLTLCRSCRCGGEGSATSDAYTGQPCADRCGAAGVEEEAYFLRVSVRLEAGEELAIGWEPSQLWLIERE